MRLIFQEVDALAVLQLYKFSDERLLTGVSLNYRPRPEAVIPNWSLHFVQPAQISNRLGLPKNSACDCSLSEFRITSFL